MLLIVHNPLSANRKSKLTTNRWVRFFKRHKIPFVLRSSLKIDDFAKYLEQHPNLEEILYLGGDGSINYLVNHMDVTKIKQKIYFGKSGSGNDYLRTLNEYPVQRSKMALAKTNVGDIRFVNGCGIGFDALVVHYVNHDTNKSKLSYFLNVFRAVYKYQKGAIDVNVDGKDYHFDDAYFIAVQNGKYFGGGMRVTPKGNPANDTFQVCVAHNLVVAKLLSLFPTIYIGKHIGIKKNITMLEGKVIKVKVPSKRYFQADGEVTEDVDTITITKDREQLFIPFSKKNYLRRNY